VAENGNFVCFPRGGGRGEPGGTRAMGVCEPGQGGNAAAISNTFMCPGEPPRLSSAPLRTETLVAGRDDWNRIVTLCINTISGTRSALLGCWTTVEKAVEHGFDRPGA